MAVVTDLIFALAVIAAAFALVYKIRYTRGLKRLAKLLEEQKRDGDNAKVQ